MTSKGVLLDSPARRRTGLSWYRPTQLQLLAARKQEGPLDGALPWSALVIEGVAVPHDEVAGVRMETQRAEKCHLGTESATTHRPSLAS